MTQPQVAALRAGGSGGYRRAWRAEQLRERFWVIPALLGLAGVASAVATVHAPRLGIPATWLSGVPVDPGETTGLLGIIASSTLTFLGVVFTLTLVALQLASSQLSPRVLRLFVRSGVTKVTFGILLATFSYSVAFLSLNGGRTHEADSRGLTVAVALVTASLISFIAYVAKTMKLLQVAWVITVVADETRSAVAGYFPAADRFQPAAAPATFGEPTTIALPADGSRGRRKAFGVLEAIDRGSLADLARRHGCVLVLLVRVGEYLPAGAAVAAAYGPPPPQRAVLAGLYLGTTRTMYQDPAFGLRQLVDIAIQALSPAVNQPTTAVQAIDRLEDILLLISRRSAASGYYADEQRQIRFVEPVLTWAQCLDLAFTEITRYGARSIQVSRRLLAAYDALERSVSQERLADVQTRKSELLATFDWPGAGSAALRADAMGLG